jgi:signal transduction histidine kinase
MQTPLAIFQSKVELLMQTSPLNEEQAQLLSDLGDASQRMTKLNRSLLLLSKIENNQFVELENVSLQKVITDFSEEYQPQAHQKQITITMEFRSDVVLEANKSLIEVMVGNLLGNAIRHNHTGGTINILLEPELFTIKNTGKAVALEEDKLFQRFQKDNPDSMGTGLGLEIVKQICNLYRYTIRYEYSDGTHAFIITLKNFSKPGK